MVKSPPENTQRLMPRLAYVDAPAAIEFLCRAFGFEETGRFAPGGRVVYSGIALNGETLFAIGSSYEVAKSPREVGGLSIELFCYVDDVDRHYAQAKGRGRNDCQPSGGQVLGRSLLCRY